MDECIYNFDKSLCQLKKNSFWTKMNYIWLCAKYVSNDFNGKIYLNSKKDSTLFVNNDHFTFTTVNENKNKCVVYLFVLSNSISNLTFNFGQLNSKSN